MAEMVLCPICKELKNSCMVYLVDWRKVSESGYHGMICHDCNKQIDAKHFTHIPMRVNTLDAWLAEHEAGE